MYYRNEGDLMKFLTNLLKDFKLITSNEGGWAWAIPAAMAAYGAYQGDQKEQRVAKQNKAAATQTQFSPWTKMGQGQLQDTGGGAIGGAVQSGIAGLGLMQGYNAANAATAAKGAATAASAAAPAAQAASSAPAAQAAFNQVPMQQAGAVSPEVANSYVAAPADRAQLGQNMFTGSNYQQPKYNWGGQNNQMLYASN